MAVLAANKSSVEALKTTANFRPKPPEIMASSDMNRSLCVPLMSDESRLIDRCDNSGDVMTMVAITASIAHRVVRRKGSRIVGLSWLMLSNPEKASQAAPKPINSSCRDMSRPGDKDSQDCAHCWIGN